MALSDEMKARMAGAKTSKQDAEALKKKIQAEKNAKAVKVKADILAKQRAAAQKTSSVAGAALGSTQKTASGVSKKIVAGSPVGLGLGKAAAPGAKIIAQYTVKKGDTLSQIAKDHYGSASKKYWELIQQANKDIIKDASLIKPGQVFKIPELPLELKKK
ncbi:MAG: LysM peptidoglycan-binding domain-containing protein [Actinobacteria bacterium]|nr:LysM peptidoglycan-binding domain-containing protein [Actinomycetota bacterium]